MDRTSAQTRPCRAAIPEDCGRERLPVPVEVAPAGDPESERRVLGGRPGRALAPSGILALLLSALTLLAGNGCSKPYCDTDDDCVEGARCDPVTHRCYVPDAGADAGDASPDAADSGPECTESAQCTAPAAPICDATDLACRACQADPECAAGHPALPVCDEPAGACVQCTDSVAHCPNPAPICNAVSQACRACQDHADCQFRDPATPACDGASCVQCTDSVLHCSGTAPVCEPLTNLCRPCDSHAECGFAGGVCDWPTGACLPETAVIYVDDDSCPALGVGTSADPYCTLQDGVDAVTSGRTTILVADGTYDEVVLQDTGPVWIVGDGPAAELTTIYDNTSVVYLSGTTSLTLENVTVRDASGTGGGVECLGDATTQPTLVLHTNTITGNTGGGALLLYCNATLDFNTITGNAYGGVWVAESSVTIHANTITGNINGGVLVNTGDVTLDANIITGNANGGVVLADSDFTVTNNIIAANGSGSSSAGGVVILFPGATAVFSHNTVVENTASGVNEAGVKCADPVDVISSVLYNNLNADLSAACTASFCWTTADGDPQFVGGGDYHLQPTSGCVDQGDSSSTLNHDIDGDPRPQGNGPDIGADEAQ